jgi:predicted DNA-binding transcriptional regulator AlpA
MTAYVTTPDHLLTLKDMMARTRRSRASIYRDIDRGLPPRPLGQRGHAARWEQRDFDTYVQKLRELRA